MGRGGLKSGSDFWRGFLRSTLSFLFVLFKACLSVMTEEEARCLAQFGHLSSSF